ncbi:MAG: PAS domain S-box protein, partial [Actinomycetota bacterium]|nr:PAS domain S-box protein [Actinomycetota bacterium]
MDTEWIVVLEAYDESGTAPIEVAALQRLMQELTDARPAALFDPHRYALQVRLTGGAPAEALFVAAARWKSAVGALGLPAWPLCRAEVLTSSEFDRDLETAFSPQPPGQLRWTTEAATPPTFSSEQLLRDAFHDSLTGLANPELFRERLRLALGAQGAPDKGAAVLLLDLDGFARVNERLGHACGDQILAMIATRLLGAVDAGGVVGRLAGDRFAVLLEEGPPHPYPPGAERALAALRMPYTVGVEQVLLTASAGLALGGAGADPDQVLREAGTAMCVAKEAGGDRLTRFEGAMTADISRLAHRVDAVVDRLAYVILLQRAAIAANTCNDLVDAASAVLREVCAHTGWPIGRLYVVADGGDQAVPTDTVVVAGLDGSRAFVHGAPAREQRRGHGLVGGVLATGSPAWRFDLANLYGEEASDVDIDIAGLAAEASIRSALAIPVLVGDDVAAVLEFFSPWDEAPEGSLLEVMAGVASQLSRVVERAGAEAALRQSEQRYRALAESARDAIISVDDHGTIVSWNDAARATFGYSEAAALGQPIAMLSPEHLGGPVGGLLDELAVRAREGGFMDLECRRQDGTGFSAEGWVSSWEADGRRHFTAIVRDVTHRRAVENDLRVSEARFRALVQTSTDAIVVLNPDGSIREHHESLGFLGYAPGANGGRSGLEFLHPDDIGQALEALMGIQAAPGVSAPYEVRVRHADGTWHWVEAVGNNLLDHPDVGGIVVLARNTTNRRQAQEALLETQARWTALFDAFAEKAVVVGHDGTVLRDLTEVTGTSLAGVALDRLAHPEDVGIVADLVLEARLASGPVGPVEARTLD